MPDENTNPVGITQTSQNNQTTTNPSGDDFVLDFGDGKVEQDDKNSEVEINNLEEEKQHEEGGIDVNINDNYFDEGKEQNKLEPNDGVQEDNIENVESSDDFDISLDNNEEVEDNNEEVEDNNEEVEDNNEEVEDNNEEVEDNNEEVEDNNEEVEDNNEEVEDNNEEVEDNNEESSNDYNISLDESPKLENENEDNNKDSSFSLDENSENEPKDSTDNELFLSDDDKNSGDISQSNDSLSLEEGEYTNEENNDAYVDSENFNNSDVRDEGFSNENSDNFGKSEDDANQGKTSDLEEDITNNDVDYTMNIPQEPLNQPEIGDLLGNSSTDFTVTDPENNAIETENNESLGVNQGLNNMQENVGFELEDKENNNITEENQNSIGSDTENQSFTLDYNYTDGNELENDNSNENVEEPNIAENNNIITDGNNIVPEENNVTIGTNQIENTDQTASQQISTLSLDQILDTELNNNPQYADNSKAVPINVSNNKGLFGNKKLVGVIAGVGLFLIAGLTVMVFPLGSSNNNSGNTVDTGQIVEEFVEDHQVADLPEEIEEDSGIDAEMEEELQGDTSVHESKVTIQDDFPDVDRDDENSSSSYDNYWDSEGGDIEPYVFSEEDNVKQTQELEIGDILPIISDYKSQAEIYHTQGDEMQDKKLIKYSLQAVNLCDDYQEQIQNGESLDEESFSSFKSKMDKILTKMEEYLGGDSYIESYQNDNYYYDFE